MIDTDWEQEATESAKAHVEWFLSALRPLLIDHMIHGFKHGMEWANEETKQADRRVVE